MADTRGHTPEDVKYLQAFLRSVGRYFGPEDGVWSQDLEEGLRSYQVSKQLGESGRLDDATRAKIERQKAGGPPPVNAIDAKVLELYGPGMAILLTNPELGPVIREAATEGWDELVLEGALQQTQWWRTSNENQRRWDELNASDPQTANQRRREEQSRVWDTGHRLGLGKVLTAALTKQITEDFLRYGWSEDQLNDVLVGLVSQLPPGSEPVGSIGGAMAEIKKMGASYLLSVSDWTARSFATQIAKGELAIEDVAITFRQQASERFKSNPGVAQAIDRGITPSSYFRNHVETIAEQLELNPDTVDLISDPRWSRIIEVPQADGSTRAMSNAELIAYARNQPEWLGTRNGKSLHSDLNRAVLETFGGIKR